MNAHPKPKPDDPEQSKRFEDTARQLEADESGKAFERALGTVVKPPTKGAKTPEPPRKKDGDAQCD